MIKLNQIIFFVRQTSFLNNLQPCSYCVKNQLLILINHQLIILVELIKFLVYLINLINF